MNALDRWRGLKALAQAAVENASSAIARVQKDTARRPYAILELLPPIGGPTRGIHLVHDAVVTSVHGTIRLTTRAVGETLDVVFDAMSGEREG